MTTTGNTSPRNYATDAIIDYAHTHTPPSPWTIQPVRSWKRIGAVIACEIQLQLRSFPFWTMLIISCAVTAYFGLQQVSIAGHLDSGGGMTLGNNIDSVSAALAVSTLETNFVLLLLPFLFVNIFARDAQRKVHPLLWTRPLSSAGYALGKGLAAVLLSVFLGLFPLIIGWITVSIARGAVQPPGLWLSMALVQAASDMLVTLFALLCISLTPLPIIGSVICAGLVVYLNIFSTKTMLSLTNLTAEGIYYSQSIGFGPDSTLLLLQRQFFVVSGMLCLGLFMLVFQWRERQALALLRHRIATILLVLVMGGLLVSLTGSFQNAVASYGDLGAAPVGPSNASVSQYRLQVQADPHSGFIKGTAIFILTPPPAGAKDVFVALNPGLQVQSIVMSNGQDGGSTEKRSAFQASSGWIRLPLAETSFIQGRPVQVTMTYAGHIEMSRDNYIQAVLGLGSRGGGGTNSTFLSYVGQNMAFLQGSGGYWYPLPWLRQVVARGNRSPFDEVRLRLPTSVQVLSSVGTLARSSDGQWQDLLVQPHGMLPMAFVAALASSNQDTAVDGATIFYRGTGLDPERVRMYHLMSQQAITLHRWLRPTVTAVPHWNTVVVPILQKPVVGPGLLFVPENPLTLYDGPNTDIAAYRFAGEQVAQAWWSSMLPFPARYSNETAFSQQAYDYIAFSIGGSLLSMLSAYSAAVTTDQLVQQHFLEREMTICQGMHDNAAGGKGAVLDPQKDQQLRNAMYPLGIDFCIDSELLLYHLQRQVGMVATTQFLQQFIAQYAQTPPDTQAFLAAMSKVQGRNMSAEAGPYICTGGYSVPPGSRDPLACLQEMDGGQ